MSDSKQESLVLDITSEISGVMDANILKREAGMFLKLDKDGDGRVPLSEFLEELEANGISRRDERVEHEIADLLENHGRDFLTLPDLLGIAKRNIVVESAFSGKLAIPRFAQMCEELHGCVENAWNETVKMKKQGQPSNLTPQLASVDPNKWGFSICSIDGQRWSIGECDERIIVQEASKPIMYSMACRLLGTEKVHKHVGREPSGRSYNEIALDSNSLPHNPYISAGAIMNAALIKPASQQADRFNYVMEIWKDLMGDHGHGTGPGFSNSHYLSLRSISDRDYCLAYMMKEVGAFPEDTDITKTLEFYFMSLSIEATCNRISLVAATLANGGVCPTSGKRVFDPLTVRNCLSLMSSCGMYDYSGKFQFEIGFPCKSGCSGVLMVVIPGLMGASIYSPRVDNQGNSVFGIQLCKQLVGRFKFHFFDSLVGKTARKFIDNGQTQGTDDEKQGVGQNTSGMPTREKWDPRNQNQNTSAEKEHTSFLYAAAEGNIFHLRRMIARGVDVDEPDYDLRTALHLAASEGRTKVVKYLICIGACINEQDRYGSTPLDDSIRESREEVRKILENPPKYAQTKRFEESMHGGLALALAALHPDRERRPSMDFTKEFSHSEIDELNEVLDGDFSTHDDFAEDMQSDTIPDSPLNVRTAKLKATTKLRHEGSVHGGGAVQLATNAASTGTNGQDTDRKQPSRLDFQTGLKTLYHFREIGQSMNNTFIGPELNGAKQDDEINNNVIGASEECPPALIKPIIREEESAAKGLDIVSDETSEHKAFVPMRSVSNISDLLSIHTVGKRKRNDSATNESVSKNWIKAMTPIPESTRDGIMSNEIPVARRRDLLKHIEHAGIDLGPHTELGKAFRARHISQAPGSKASSLAKNPDHSTPMKLANRRDSDVLKRLSISEEEILERPLEDDLEWLEDLRRAFPVVQSAVEGSTVIPDWNEFCNDLKEIFAQVEKDTSGDVARYIPQLANVNPEKFGLAVCTIDCQQFEYGDSEELFCVQSCMKPIAYCIAVEENGTDSVHKHVGREPSGRNFNELALDKNNLPHNPLINAGAIMTCSLIRPNLSLSARFEHFSSVLRHLTGGIQPEYSNATFLSEFATADRNFCLGYLMKEKGAFPAHINSSDALREALEFYFQCCSVELTCKALSIVAATLANGGVCPITSKRIFSEDTVRNCLSLMSSSGMYDYSGEFQFSIGFPVKSGVAGALLIVVPNVMGMCTWSPRLDRLGNSARGIQFCQLLGSRFSVHMFDRLRGVTEKNAYSRCVHDAEARKIQDKKNPLLHKGRDVEMQLSRMTYAAARGDIQEIKRMVALGVDLNLADYDGRTALHLAASEGQLEVVRFMCDNGATVDKFDRWKGTPISDAQQYEHHHTAKFLKIALQKQALTY